jgi:Zn-dependent protease/CBS domain-containing protein
MTWSFRLARILGTDVKVHFTFILLLVFLFVSTGRTQGAETALWVTGFFLALFFCVLLHEFGHILMARRFGIRTPDVILLPIGGVARLERIPEEPRQELLIAIAGPLVTLAIAAIMWGWLRLAGEPAALLPADAFSGGFAADLLRVNVLLFLFNLLPAFPLDGGRVLRSLLATRMSYVRATRIAASGGQMLAMVLGIAGLFYNPLWLFIALFVYFGAGQEAAQAEARAAGRGIIVDQMMVTKFETLPVHATLRDAVDRLLDGEQREFPVVDNAGRVEGILTRDHLIRGLTERGPDSPVADAMAKRVPVLELGLPFETALEQLRMSGLPALPVGGRDQQIVGLLTLDNITDLILVRRAVAR